MGAMLTCDNCYTNFSLGAGNASCIYYMICGNSFVEGFEQCDDSNTVDGDGCNADCTFGNNNGCPAATPYRDPLTNLCTLFCPTNGYYTNATNYSCLPCSYSCDTCSNQTLCDSCSAISNRIFNNGFCDPMPGFFDNGTQVAPACISPCDNCTSTTVCTSCVYSYFLNATFCQSCSLSIANCDTCSGYPPICTLCQSGFIYVNTTNKCIPLCTDINCISCPASVSICAICAPGFMLTARSTCRSFKLVSI